MIRPSREAFRGVAIDLVNTVDVHGDSLDDPGGPAAWALANRVALGPVDGFGADDGRRLVELRGAVRELLSAVTAGEHPSAASLEAVNAAAALAPGHPQLTWPVGGSRRAWTERGGTIGDAVLSAVARSTIELLAGADADRLRGCAAPGCPRFFVARDARRVWCDSRTCGNRVRVARHAARRRTERSTG
jgi:predicted RNA-binding Zn ribbon-like protein